MSDGEKPNESDGERPDKLVDFGPDVSGSSRTQVDPKVQDRLQGPGGELKSSSLLDEDAFKRGDDAFQDFRAIVKEALADYEEEQKKSEQSNEEILVKEQFLLSHFLEQSEFEELKTGEKKEIPEKERASNGLSKKIMEDEVAKKRVGRKDEKGELKTYPMLLNTGRFAIWKGKNYKRSTNQVEEDLGLGAVLYFRQIKNLVLVLIISTLLSIPAYILYSTGKPLSGKKVEEEQGPFNSFVTTMSLGNLGDKTEMQYVLDQKKAKNNLDLFCDAGTIDAIQHYELIIDAQTNKDLPEEDEQFCEMDALPKTFSNQYYERCYYKLYCKVQFDIDTAAIQKCKAQFLEQKPGLDISRARLEFSHRCDNTSVDTAFGTMHRLAVGNVIVICDLVVVLLFIANIWYVSRRVQQHADDLNNEKASILNYTCKITHLPIKDGDVSIEPNALKPQLKEYLEKVVQKEAEWQKAKREKRNKIVANQDAGASPDKEGPADSEIASIYFAYQKFDQFTYLTNINAQLKRGTNLRLWLKHVKAKEEKKESLGCLQKLKFAIFGKQEDNKSNYQMEKRRAKTKYTEIIKLLQKETKALKSFIESDKATEGEKKFVNPAVVAYVTFRKMEGASLCSQALASGGAQACFRQYCASKDPNKTHEPFKNKHLVVKEPVDPSVINWPNMKLSTMARTLRFVGCTLMLILWLFITLFVVQLVTKAIADAQMKVPDCKKLGAISPALAFKTQNIYKKEGFSNEMFCFCQDVWESSILKANTNFLSDLKREFENGTAYCYDWYLEKTKSYFIGLIAMIIVKANSFLVKTTIPWTKSLYGFQNLQSQMNLTTIQTFWSSFFTECLLVQLVFFNFFGLGEKRDFDEEQVDREGFSTEWYFIVGVAMMWLIVTSFTSPIVDLAKVLGNLLWGQISDRSFSRDYGKTKKYIQDEYNGLYTGLPFSFDEKYAQILLVLAVTFLFSGGLPIAYPIAVGYFLCQYAVDKFILFKLSAKPIRFNEKVSQNSISMYKWILLAHLIGFVLLFGVTKILDQDIITAIKEGGTSAFDKKAFAQKTEGAATAGETPKYDPVTGKPTRSSTSVLASKTSTTNTKPTRSSTSSLLKSDHRLLNDVLSARHLEHDGDEGTPVPGQDGMELTLAEYMVNMIYVWDTFDMCVSDPDCPGQALLWLQDDLTPVYGSEVSDFIDTCKNDPVCSTDWMQYMYNQMPDGDKQQIDQAAWDQLKADGYQKVPYFTWDEYLQPQPGQNGLEATFAEFLVNVIYNYEFFNECVADFECPVVALLWLQDDMTPIYGSEVQTFIDQCKNDAVCSTNWMQYVYNQMPDGDKQSIDQAAWDQLQANGQPTAPYFTWDEFTAAGPRDPLQGGSQPVEQFSTLEKSVFTEARYNSCAATPECSRDPFNYLSSTLPTELSTTRDEIEGLLEFMNFCDGSEAGCETEQLNAYYYEIQFVSGGLGEDVYYQKGDTVDFEEWFFTQKRYDACVADSTCSASPTTYWRENLKSTPYATQVDQYMSDCEEFPECRDNTLAFFKEEVDYFSFSQANYVDEDQYIKELQIVYGDQYDFTNDTYPYNATYYQSWYQQDKAVKIDPKYDDGVNYSYVNTSFSYAEFEKIYNSKQSEEEVTSLFPVYFWLNNVFIVLFLIWVMGLKHLVNLAISLFGKQENEKTGRRKLEVYYEKDWFAIIDKNTLKQEQEQLKEDAGQEQRKAEIQKLLDAKEKDEKDDCLVGGQLSYDMYQTEQFQGLLGIQEDLGLNN